MHIQQSQTLDHCAFLAIFAGVSLRCDQIQPCCLPSHDGLLTQHHCYPLSADGPEYKTILPFICTVPCPGHHISDSDNNSIFFSIVRNTSLSLLFSLNGLPTVLIFQRRTHVLDFGGKKTRLECISKVWSARLCLLCILGSVHDRGCPLSLLP